jgi:hypothetical protein
VLIPLQILAGDFHGLNTLQHQPAKVAAMEGIWETQRGAPLLLFAVPDQEARTNHFEIGIPKGAALILKHDAEGELQGLNDFVGAHPPVAPVFYAFRVMVGTGMLMLLASWGGLWLLKRRGWNGAALPRPVLGGLALMAFSGWTATVAGWYVTEVGRQPWIVQGLLRVDEAEGRLTPVMTSSLRIKHAFDSQPPFIQKLLGSSKTQYRSYLWQDANGDGDQRTEPKQRDEEESPGGPRLGCSGCLRLRRLVYPGRHRGCRGILPSGPR